MCYGGQGLGAVCRRIVAIELELNECPYVLNGIQVWRVRGHSTNSWSWGSKKSFTSCEDDKREASQAVKDQITKRER
jgi:hypothetical protein